MGFYGGSSLCAAAFCLLIWPLPSSSTALPLLTRQTFIFYGAPTGNKIGRYVPRRSDKICGVRLANLFEDWSRRVQL